MAGRKTNYVKGAGGRFAGSAATGGMAKGAAGRLSGRAKGLLRRTDASRSINASNAARRPAFSGQLLQRGGWSGSAKPRGTLSASASGRRMDRRDQNARQQMGDRMLEKGNMKAAREFYTGRPVATVKKIQITAPQKLRSLTGTSKPRGSTISGTRAGREALSGDKPVFLRNKRASRTYGRRQGPSAGARYRGI